MKIEKKEAPFRPVTITLETQEELDFFTCMADRTGGEVAVRLYGSTWANAELLVRAGGNLNAYRSEGSIHIRSHK